MAMLFNRGIFELAARGSSVDTEMVWSDELSVSQLNKAGGMCVRIIISRNI